MATDPPPHDPETGEVLDQDDEPFKRPFIDFLLEHNKGKTAGELTDALHDLVAGVTDTRKAGKLQLTLSIAPMKKGGDGVLMVSDVIKVSVPQHDRADSIFYADENGNLTREDPNQPTISGLRQVPETVKTVREVPSKEKRA